MAIEEEFSIEIPDKEADAIHSGKAARRANRCAELLTSRSTASGDLYLRPARCALSLRHGCWCEKVVHRDPTSCT